MLVLSRKPGEQVVIDGGIVVTVTAIDGGRVKIGIEVPEDVSILRGELVDDQDVSVFSSQWRKADQVKLQAALADADADAHAPSRNPLRRLRKIPR